MKSARSLVASSLVAALAIIAIAVPASAAPTKGSLTVLNGRPGTRVDICIGKTKELRSNLGYGSVARKRLAGTRALRFRKAAPGICKGKVLAGKALDLSGGANMTVVLTTRTPKVLVYDDADVDAQAPEGGSGLGIRHAADLAANNVYMRRTIWKDPFVKDDPIGPALISTFAKGDQGVFPLVILPDYVMRIKATRADAATVVAKAPLIELDSGLRYEFILIGTKASNARMVSLVTALSAP